LLSPTLLWRAAYLLALGGAGAGTCRTPDRQVAVDM